jgi:hypothetical protein
MTMPRDMTEEELKRFEEEELHQEPRDQSGPASEADLVRDRQQERPRADPEVPPLNPD